MSAVQPSELAKPPLREDCDYYTRAYCVLFNRTSRLSTLDSPLLGEMEKGERAVGIKTEYEKQTTEGSVTASQTRSSYNPFRHLFRSASARRLLGMIHLREDVLRL